MKYRAAPAVIAVIAVAIGLATVPSLQAQENGFEAKIGRVRAVVLTPDFSRDDIARALVEALDASLLILPAADYAAEFRSRVETVQKMFADGALLEDKARQYLGLAYKMVAGGESWKVPEELMSAYRAVEITERGKKVCVALLDSSLADHKAGRNEAAVRGLIGFVIFVITPVEA
jgi:hypothetical protein